MTHGGSLQDQQPVRDTARFLKRDDRVLLVRLTSLGDVLHTLPAVEALREAYPDIQFDWLIEEHCAPVIQGSPAVHRVIPVKIRSWASLRSTVRKLRAAHYTCAVDFQGRYKSAALALLSGAPRRVGFHGRAVRESAAALCYTERVVPAGTHAGDIHLSLAAYLGAPRPARLFPIAIPRESSEAVDDKLSKEGICEFYALFPGGSWGAKRWPPERFGELHRELEARGWRGVMILGPKERKLGERLIRAAAPAAPVWIPTDLPELMALLRRARFLVGVDSGPMHLAVALGLPVVALFGPTDPARNGPFSENDIVVRNARAEETSYKRRMKHAASMLTITVAQVLAAIDERLARAGIEHPARAQERR